MLYHISPFKIDNWKPRIPSTRLKNEDGNIERICMAESVIGCLTAVNGKDLLTGLLNLERKAKIPALLYLYYIDEEDLNKENYLSNCEIQNKKLVPDADITKEVWLLKSANMKYKIIHIKDFSFKIINFNNNKDIYNQIVTITDCKYTLEKNSENISLHSFFWKELKNISNKLNKKYNKKMNIISFPYNCSEDEDLLNILSEFSKKIREKLKIGLV